MIFALSVKVGFCIPLAILENVERNHFIYNNMNNVSTDFN